MSIRRSKMDYEKLRKMAIDAKLIITPRHYPKKVQEDGCGFIDIRHKSIVDIQNNPPSQEAIDELIKKAGLNKD